MTQPPHFESTSSDEPTDDPGWKETPVSHEAHGQSFPPEQGSSSPSFGEIPSSPVPKRRSNEELSNLNPEKGGQPPFEAEVPPSRQPGLEGGYPPPGSSWPPPGTWPPGGGWQPPYQRGWPPQGTWPPGGGWPPQVEWPGEPTWQQGQRPWTLDYRQGPYRPSRPRPILTVLVVIAVALAFGIGIGYFVYGSNNNHTVVGGSTTGRSRTLTRTRYVGGNTRTSSTRTTAVGGSTSSASGSPSNLNAIATKVDPGLVDINTKLNYEDEQAAGTGMVLTSTGEILTNNHVIDGETTLSVYDIGNHKTYPAKVVGYDRSKDVAVIHATGASGLSTVTLGNSTTISIGEGIVGIGNAEGAGGTPSVSGGSITSLNQSITASDSLSGTSENLTGLVETNAQIQPGDSGGPLVTATGKVVGMDTAASQGFSFRTSAIQAFSIPINEALTLAKQYEAGHKTTTIHIGPSAFLGVEVRPTTAQAPAKKSSTPFFGTSTTQTRTTAVTSTKGAHILGVLTGTPASGSGLAKGDVIVKLAGTTVSSADSLSLIIGKHQPGNKVLVSWVNQTGKSESATLTLTQGPPD